MRIDAVKEVTIRVQAGEWVGIYGSNGSGKTTLLKLAAGLLQPDSGSVTAHGTVSPFFELGIGFHPERAARENIRLHGLLHGLSTHQIDALMPLILEFSGIGAFADLPIKCYSTGMRLRLAFAAAAHLDADIYLLDEIMAVGDVEFRQKCMGFLRGLKKRGKTVLLVSHNLTELCRLSDRILFADHGTFTERKRAAALAEANAISVLMDQTDVVVSI